MREKSYPQNLTPSEYWTQASNEPLIPSPTLSFYTNWAFTTLNFCSCTTWFFNLEDLELIEHDYVRSLKSQSYKQIPS